jgi:exopolysaccharide biosynthesis protein
LNHFNKKGDTVTIMSGGDGGGSTKLVVNGQLVGGSLAEYRAVPTILAW